MSKVYLLLRDNDACATCIGHSEVIGVWTVDSLARYYRDGLQMLADKHGTREGFRLLEIGLNDDSRVPAEQRWVNPLTGDPCDTGFGEPVLSAYISAYGAAIHGVGPEDWPEVT